MRENSWQELVYSQLQSECLFRIHIIFQVFPFGLTLTVSTVLGVVAVVVLAAAAIFFVLTFFVVKIHDKNLCAVLSVTYALAICMCDKV